MAKTFVLTVQSHVLLIVQTKTQTFERYPHQKQIFDGYPPCQEIVNDLFQSDAAIAKHYSGLKYYDYCLDCLSTYGEHVAGRLCTRECFMRWYRQCNELDYKDRGLRV